MRKLYFLLAVVIAIALIGCSGGNKSNNSGTTNNNSNGNLIDNQIKQSGPITFDSNNFRSNSTVEIDPDHLRVFTGATDEELNARIKPIGAEVTSRNGNFVTIKVNPSSITETANIVGRLPGVFSVEPVQTYISESCTTIYNFKRNNNVNIQKTSRPTSFYAGDVYYDDRRVIPNPDPTKYTDPANDVLTYGQRFFLEGASPSGGWDIVTTDNVLSSKITLAIIDGGISTDYNYAGGVNLHPDLAIDVNANVGKTTINTASGFVSDKGVASTIGSLPWTSAGKLENITWPYKIDGTNLSLYRMQGNIAFSLIAADLNNNIIITDNMDGGTKTRKWIGSMAGINPYIDLLIIKTGIMGKDKANNDIWTFPDASIAESIKYAVNNGANVIYLGMWAEGTVPAIIATEIANAKAKDVLVIAPAGGSPDMDVKTNPNLKDPDGSTSLATPSWSGDEYFDNQTTVDKISPAGDPNVLSVGAIGVNHFLDTQTNSALPFNQVFNPPFQESINEIAGYSTKGAVIGAPGFAFSFDYLYRYNWYSPLNGGTSFSAAIAAGAASIVYKGLKSVTGTLPAGARATAWDLLSKNSEYMQPDFQFGRLNIGRSSAVAANGGFSKPSDPSLDFTDFQTTPEPNKVGTNQEFSIQFSFSGGDSASYQYKVIWGDETETAWINTTDSTNIIVKKPASYSRPGNYTGTVVLKDGKNKFDSLSFAILVTNPLGVNVVITNKASGTALDANNLKASTTYVFTADVSNVMNFPGNNLSYVWDIDGVTQTDKKQSIIYTAPSAKTSTITVTVTESIRTSVSKAVTAKFQ